MAIFFHDEAINSGLKHKREIKSWFKEVLLLEGRGCGEINVVLTSDDYLRGINRKYLSRDYYTDIITFGYTEGNKVSGDLFISLDRVRENAGAFGTEESDELLRVMVHGLLHLSGHEDGTEDQKKKMSKKEDEYLKLFNPPE